MTQKGVPLPEREIAADTLGFFRWGDVAGGVLVTNDAGDWAFLSQDEFDDLLAGRVAAEHPRFEEFQKKGLVREGLDLDALAARLAQRNRHIRRGPHLHVVHLIGSATDSDRPMTLETATAIVDFALKGTSPSITFEIQARGGEPLENLATLQHLIEAARERNKRDTGKTLRISLISNFSAMNEEIAEWLIAHDVLLTTFFDGPAAVHDANRAKVGGTAQAEVASWLDYFHRRYAELGGDAQQGRIDTLLTVTKQTIDAWRQVLDTHVERGLRSIRLQPLDPDRFDAAVWASIGYTVEEYLDFYRRALADILKLNGRGVEFAERLATVIAAKILTADDPGIVDIQSPYGAGTAQIAYDADGRVFPCDEARRAAASGEDLFALGNVSELSIADVARHPTVRAIASASLLDAQPMCADCWNKPFCGFSPVRNYLTRGDLFGRRTSCLECKEHMAVSRQLFELLVDTRDTASAAILGRWTANRPPQAVDARARIEPS